MICRSVGLSVYRFVGLPVCRSVGLSVCRSVGLWVCWLVEFSIGRLVVLSVWFHFEGAWGSLRLLLEALGHLASIFGALEVSEASFWRLLNSILAAMGYLGRLGGGLGDHLGPKGLLLAAHLELWRHLALHFRSSGGVQGSIWCLLGSILGALAALGRIGGALGLTWGPHGSPWPPKGSQRYHFWFILVAFWMHCKRILNVKIDSKSDQVFKLFFD